MGNLEAAIAAMMGGNSAALEEVSKAALGGNEIAREAIRAEEAAHTDTKVDLTKLKYGGAWSREVEEGVRGPRQGDVMLGEV